MITPLIMVLLLIGPVLIASITSRLTAQQYDIRAAAAFGLVLLFGFTSLGHFVQTDAMVQMLPAWVPQRALLVHLTGVLEILIAAGFALPPTRRFTGVIAAAVLVLFLPVNIHAALNHVPMGAHAWGPRYLLIRVPLQGLIFAWVCWFTIRSPVHAGR